MIFLLIIFKAILFHLINEVTPKDTFFHYLISKISLHSQLKNSKLVIYLTRIIILILQITQPMNNILIITHLICLLLILRKSTTRSMILKIVNTIWSGEHIKKRKIHLSSLNLMMLLDNNMLKILTKLGKKKITYILKMFSYLNREIAKIN